MTYSSSKLYGHVLCIGVHIPGLIKMTEYLACLLYLCLVYDPVNASGSVASIVRMTDKNVMNWKGAFAVHFRFNPPPPPLPVCFEGFFFWRRMKNRRVSEVRTWHRPSAGRKRRYLCELNGMSLEETGAKCVNAGIKTSGTFSPSTTCL